MDCIEQRMAVLKAHLDEARQRRGKADVEFRAAVKALDAAKQSGDKGRIAKASRRLHEAGEAVNAATMAEAQARYLNGD